MLYLKIRIFSNNDINKGIPLKYLAIIFLIAILFFISGCDSDNPVSPYVNKIRDIDGNLYGIVKIGDQVWMAENLRTTRYRNGDTLLTGLNNTAWESTINGAYAIYPHSQIEGLNSDEAVVAAYGKLYNWYAVDDDRGLCPEGWRVPSDVDWKQLEMYLGMSQQVADKSGWRGTNEGDKLKSTRTAPEAHPRWRNPNIGASNESEWSGLPGGIRYYKGSHSHVGNYGYWWSSTERDYLSAWLRELYYDRSSVYRQNSDKRVGRSVRCLRDE